MGDAHADISRHVRSYLGVFGALSVATVLTVGAAQFDFGGHLNMVIALIIASVKASLVAAIFMHLKWESSHAIWWTLAICVVFFLVLILLPVLSVNDLPPQVQERMWG